MNPGATLSKPAAGTSSDDNDRYFANPDGRPRTPAVDPFWGLDEAGRVVVPK